jgi:hypothetical protein
MFLSEHSAMSFSAWGSIHVLTNVATLMRALPSSIRLLSEHDQLRLTEAPDRA